MEKDIPEGLSNRLGETAGTNKLVSECLEENLDVRSPDAKSGNSRNKMGLGKNYVGMVSGKWRIKCVYVKIYDPVQWDA